MGERGIRYCGSAAFTHLQGVDALQMSKGGVHKFSAEHHVQAVYTLEMNEGIICQMLAVRDIERLDPVDLLKGGVRKGHLDNVSICTRRP